MIITPFVFNPDSTSGLASALADGFKEIKEIVLKIYACAVFTFEIFFQLFRLGGKMLRRKYWDQANVSFFTMLPEEKQRMDLWMRRNFYDRVKIGPEVGLDPRINKDFFALTAQPEQTIPEPPEENIKDLVTLFNQHVPPESPLISDKDTPATYAELQAGIDSFMKEVLGEKYHELLKEKYPNTEILHKLLKHLCVALKKEDLSAKTKEYWLVELARAGKRQCPTRMSAVCRTGYDALVVGEVQMESLQDRLVKIYHDLRSQIIKQMADDDDSVHREGELLLAIGKDLNIQNAELAYNDDIFLVDELAPQRSFPKFFKKCTAQRIIECFTRAINGDAVPGRSKSNREGKKIPNELLWDWFFENIPSDFHPELSGEDRKLAFVDSTDYAEKGLFKEKGVVYLLSKMPIPILNY